jgi:ArsR family transcriptional regulator, arsenate/arsenite/antimonite-responsive transcriptional repressor
MDQKVATAIFESLASAVRLDVYRLLVRHAPDGLVAGEIATVLDVPPNNLSFHLKALVQAGLVAFEQQGRYLRYRANLPLMRDVVTYLTAECCAGKPGRCILPASSPRPSRAAVRSRRASRLPS